MIQMGSNHLCCSLIIWITRGVQTQVPINQIMKEKHLGADSLFRDTELITPLVLRISRGLQTTTPRTSEVSPLTPSWYSQYFRDKVSFYYLGLSCWRSANNCCFAFVATSLSFMDSCNFELENVCGMIQSSGDNADWQWVSEVPRGPESDHSSMGQCKGKGSEILLDFTLGGPSIFLCYERLGFYL